MFNIGYNELSALRSLCELSCNDELSITLNDLCDVFKVKSPLTARRALSIMERNGLIEIIRMGRGLSTLIRITGKGYEVVDGGNDVDSSGLLKAINERLDKCARYIVQLERRISALEEKK